MKRIIADPLLDEAENIDKAVVQMRELGVLKGPGECNHRKPSASVSVANTLFEALRSAVRKNFKIPWTSITPPMDSLVVAHDTVPEWFVRSAGEYLNFVRDPAHFRESVSVEPDNVGIEVSVK
jgi:hypothetical protein